MELTNDGAPVAFEARTHRSQQARRKMLRRMLSLGIGESANVVLQPLVFFGLLELPTSTANVTGMALIVLILVQGSAYWFVKRFQISRNRTRLPRVRAFIALHWINPILLGLGLLLILPSTNATPNLASWPALGFWAFAVLEYVNYFHIQLMPTESLRGWLPRRSHLSNDLRHAKVISSQPSEQQLA